MSQSPIKNKHPQIKIKRFHLRALSIDSMNQSQIQEEIAKEEKILNNFLTNYNYTNAEKCDKKITVLKKVLKKKKTNELKRRHTLEKENLKIDEFSDMNNLKYFWAQKLEELKARSLAALEELKKNQKMEYQQLMSQRDKIINVKPSSLFLKLQKEEEGLVKLRKFREAQYVHKRKEEQRKKDINRSGKNQEKTLKFLEKKLLQKHSNEELYLEIKFQTEYDELMKAKQMQLESINKKYSVKNKDLLKHQKREDNINQNNNYRKRIGQLLTKYYNNFVIDQKEYPPQKPLENITHIYADLSDHNLIGSEMEHSQEKSEGNNIYENRFIRGNNNYSNDQKEILQNEINKNEEN